MTTFKTSSKSSANLAGNLLGHVADSFNPYKLKNVLITITQDLYLSPNVRKSSITRRNAEHYTQFLKNIYIYIYTLLLYYNNARQYNLPALESILMYK